MQIRCFSDDYPTLFLRCLSNAVSQMIIQHYFSDVYPSMRQKMSRWPSCRSTCVHMCLYTYRVFACQYV